jgi:serine protease Do
MVITAAHVVGDMPIAQIISDNGATQTGTVLWVNKAYDIAAIEIDGSKNLPASLACRIPTVGETIDAEGQPVGIKFITMHGYVAGEARELAPKWKSAFVADLTVISGMSGGGVYDQFGDVIGITVGAMDPHGAPDAPASGGLGFIVPSSVVCSLLGRA